MSGYLYLGTQPEETGDDQEYEFDFNSLGLTGDDVVDYLKMDSEWDSSEEVDKVSNGEVKSWVDHKKQGSEMVVAVFWGTKFVIEGS